MKKNIYLLEPQIKSTIDFDFNGFYARKLENPNHHQNYFESQLELFLNTDKKVCLLNSGTSALHLSLVLSEISINDVVFCSNSTFIATVNPILYVNATPCFIDIDIETGNMDMDYLELAIKETIKLGKSAKAVIVTHSYGIPANMDKLIELKVKYNLVLIEDAAEALGSKYKNLNCGTLADFGVLSFNSNKMNGTFGGGAIIVKDDETKMKVKKYSTHFKDKAFDFRHSKLAYNYRMNDLAAYLGAIQLKDVDNELVKKNKLHLKYKGLLKESLITVDNFEIESNYWLNCVKIPVDTFEQIHKHFSKENIEIRRVWFPLSMQPYLKKYSLFGNGESLKFYNSTICIPSTTSLTIDDIKKNSSIILNINN